MEQTHILVATDFSQSSLVAVQTAARLVQTLNGKVTMLHCIERHRAFPEIGVPQVPTALSSTGLHPYESALSGQQEDLAQAAREALARICNDHFPQIEAKLAVIHDDSPVDGICRYAEAHGADWLVVGTHGHSGLGQLLLGTGTEHIVRHAPCTVVVARG